MLALNRNKDLVFTFVNEEKGDQEVVGMSFGQLVEDYLPGITRADDSSLQPHFGSTDTWLVRVGRYDNKPVSLATFTSMNHFEPAFHREQIGEANLTTGFTNSLSVISKELADIERSQKKLKDKKQLFNKAQWESLETSKRELQEEDAARKLFINYDVLTKRVPGDGDCGLWTFLALERGPGFDVDGFFSDSDNQKLIADLRQD